jgi:hypothetical protein
MLTYYYFGRDPSNTYIGKYFMLSFPLAAEETTDDEATAKCKYVEKQNCGSMETSFDSVADGINHELEAELGQDVVNQRWIRQAKWLTSYGFNQLGNFSIFTTREKQSVMITFCV